VELDDEIGDRLRVEPLERVSPRRGSSRLSATLDSRRLLRGSSERLPPLYNTAPFTGVWLMCPVRAPRLRSGPM
jgi:hypothetical protein